jgi:ABC-type multidrug transport system permease subunit
MLALGAVALGGVLVAFLIALLIGAAIYYVGIYILHAPQPIVGIVAFIVFLLILLYGLPGGTLQ